MSRYNKIDRRLWSDHKFKTLSPLPPSGQSLWLYLLTCLHNSNIPGAIVMGKAAIAEELEWDLKKTEQCFDELIEKKMVKVDFKSRLIFLPNSLKYNMPNGPNAIPSWADTWDLIPECQLKNEIFISIKSIVCASSKAMSDAFITAFGTAYDTPSYTPSDTPSYTATRIQEQEQEQEQEQKDITSALPPSLPFEKKTRKDILKDEHYEILQYLNLKSGRVFRRSDIHLRHIGARIAEGATEGECRGVIDAKCNEWGSDEKMSRYLTPQTLFSRSNFAKYVDCLLPAVAVAPLAGTRIEKYEQVISPGAEWLTAGVAMQGVSDV